MIISEDKMSIKGGLNGLRIDACPYNPSERKGKTTKVIQRVCFLHSLLISNIYSACCVEIVSKSRRWEE